jgi:cytoskeleton protein RodZ
MTVTHHNPQGEEPAEPRTSPGHRLREARLADKISVDEVASRLHLDSRLIEALENDRYADLPEATFVRGYLRGYASLLGLPPAPIIEAYDRHGFRAPDLIPDIASKPQAQSSDTPVRLVTFVIVALLIGLASAWWWQTQQPLTTIEGTVPGIGEPAPGPSGPVAVETGPEQTPPPIATPAPPPGVVQPQPRPEPEAGAVERSIAAASPVPLPEAVTGTEEAPASAVVPEQDASPAPPAPEPSAEEQVAGRVAVTGEPDRLVIRLTHDSWIEVYDREDQRLYFGLAKGGTQITPTGSGPMRVLLGYARDVEVEYNGRSFDPAPYTRQDVARFTIGVSRTQEN